MIAGVMPLADDSSVGGLAVVASQEWEGQSIVVDVVAIVAAVD